MVKEGICKKDKSLWAIKTINKRRFKDRKLTLSFFNDLRAECQLMAAASDHPHIIDIKEVFEDINNLYIGKNVIFYFFLCFQNINKKNVEKLILTYSHLNIICFVCCFVVCVSAKQ